MSFLYPGYIIPLVTILVVFIFFNISFEIKYYRWIREHWFLQQTIVGRISSVLVMIGFLILSVIILDPRDKEIKVKMPVKKSKTIILIDTSTSMLVEDVRPNRLERATLLAKHYARRASNHQISIMIFADVTKKLVPFTNDRDLIDARIDSVKEIRNLNAGTSVEKAIAEASRIFNVKDKNVAGNILVITDGEDHGNNVSINVPDSIKVAFLGVGTPEGGNIPLKDARGMFYGYKKDRAQTVISKLNRKYFDNAVGSKPNRKYFEASVTSIPSDEIFAFFNTNDGEMSEEENSIRPLGIKRFAYPGLVLIIVGLLLRIFPQLGVAMLILSFNSFANEVPEEISRKLDLLKDGRLTKEEKINLADNLTKYKMSKLANEIYSEQFKDGDFKKFPESYFNWATALLEEKNYGDAINKYQRLEDVFPDNKELTSKIRENIKRSMQKAQSDKKEEKDKKEKNNKEKNKNQKQDQNNNEKNDQEKNESQSGDEGEGDEKSDSSGNQSNNPFDLRDQDTKDSDTPSGSQDEKSGKDEKTEESRDSKEEQAAEQRKAPTPLLEQLKQDDRRLQIKLLDTSTQGTQDSRKKDW